ncbi:MAG: hypothetical protein K8J31_12535 [Anaerolineae bacterium]|nr:hypothetical protein [Anaerolineae bacterium]
MSRSNRRYRDLKQQIQRPAPLSSQAERRDDLGQALDEVNAWGLLEEQQQAHHRLMTCFGPAIFRGYLPVAWAGVAIWHKPRGYYFYDTLGLLGIWALRTGERGVEMVVGTRVLTYMLPFFNPESYYRRIQTEFRTFYKESASPPPDEQRRYTACYDPARRLDLRREIEDEVSRWAAEQDALRRE